MVNETLETLGSRTMMTQTDCEKALSSMTSAEQVRFLTTLGHTLTIAARGAYEFQAPGVTNPRLFRDFNEIHHRIYPQIRSLVGSGKPAFDAERMVSWLIGEGKSEEFQRSRLWAFEVSLQRASA